MNNNNIEILTYRFLAESTIWEEVMAGWEQLTV